MKFIFFKLIVKHDFILWMMPNKYVFLSSIDTVFMKFYVDRNYKILDFRHIDTGVQNLEEC